MHSTEAHLSNVRPHPHDGSGYGGFGPAILGITWAEAIMATIIVALRAFTAIRVLGNPGWDLLCVVAAWVITLVAQSFLTVSVSFGTGNHISEIPSAQDLSRSLLWSWLAQYVLLIVAAVGKLAVVALLLRVQGPGHRKKTWFMMIVWTLFTLLSIVQLVLVVTQCKPVRKLWDFHLPGTCHGRARAEKVGFATGGLGAFADISLAIYPYFVFWNLDMSWRKKLGLSLLMSGGLLAAVVTIIKTIYIQRAPKRNDPTYSISPLLICALYVFAPAYSTEIWAVILLSSIPQIRVLFMAKWNSSSHSDISLSTADSVSIPRERETLHFHTQPEMEAQPQSQPLPLSESNVQALEARQSAVYDRDQRRDLTESSRDDQDEEEDDDDDDEEEDNEEEENRISEIRHVERRSDHLGVQ